MQSTQIQIQILTKYKQNTNKIQTKYKQNTNKIQTKYKQNTNKIQTKYKQNTNKIQTKQKQRYVRDRDPDPKIGHFKFKVLKMYFTVFWEKNRLKVNPSQVTFIEEDAWKKWRWHFYADAWYIHFYIEDDVESALMIHRGLFMMILDR